MMSGVDGRMSDVDATPISGEDAQRLLRQANLILERGTLVWDRERSTVAYAFVLPIELRDDLADIVADIEIASEDRP